VVCLDKRDWEDDDADAEDWGLKSAAGWTRASIVLNDSIKTTTDQIREWEERLAAGRG
jgi:hypothetical protein